MKNLFLTGTCLLITLIGIIENACSQSRIHIGMDGGINKNITQVYSSDNTFNNTFSKSSNINNLNLMYGLYFGYEIKKNFSIETGFYKSDFSNYFIINDGLNENFYSLETYNLFKVPVNAKFDLDLFKNKLFVSGSTGIAFVFFREKHDYLYNSQTDTFPNIYNPEIKTIITTGSGNFQHNTMVCEAGIGIDYYVSQNLCLVFKSNYTLGLKTLNMTDISYYFNNDAGERTGSLLFKGDAYSLLLGIKYKLAFNHK